MGPGWLLVATPRLHDPNFRRTVVYLVAHSDEGSVGVVLNRPSEAPVQAALPTWGDYASAPAVLGVGGPVQTDAAMALGVLRREATREELEPGSTHDVAGPVVLVNLDADPALAMATLRGVRIFAGHAGWGPGQLREEVEAGGWTVLPGLPDDVLSAPIGDLWFRVLRRQGWPGALQAYTPTDVTRN